MPRPCSPDTAPAAIRGAALAVLVAILVLLTAARNGVWRDEITLWRNAASQAPGNLRALDNLCFHLAAEKVPPADALQACRRAVNLHPRDYEPHVTLWQVYVRSGMRQEAKRELRRALRLLNSRAVPHRPGGVSG